MPPTNPDPHTEAPAPDRASLLPCPFCGCPGELCSSDDGNFVVACQHCGACGPSHSTDGDAEVVWNERHPRAAIALADQEAAERVPSDLWAEWENLIDDYRREVWDSGSNDYAASVDDDIPQPSNEWSVRTSLDALVRRLIALAEAGRAVPENRS